MILLGHIDDGDTTLTIYTKDFTTFFDEEGHPISEEDMDSFLHYLENPWSEDTYCEVSKEITNDYWICIITSIVYDFISADIYGEGNSSLAAIENCKANKNKIKQYLDFKNINRE